MTKDQLIHYFIILACSVVLLISGSVIVGYAINKAPFFQLSVTPMAFDTAICLLLIASAMIIRSVHSFGKK